LAYKTTVCRQASAKIEFFGGRLPKARGPSGGNWDNGRESLDSVDNLQPSPRLEAAGAAGLAVAG